MKKLATIAADGRLKIQKISDRVWKVRPSMLPRGSYGIVGLRPYVENSSVVTAL